MKRWLFSLATALSLLLSIAAATAWAMSYAQPLGWRSIGFAHSADLTRVDRERRTALFTTTANWPTSPNHGFWDAWWALSQSGLLTLLAQVIDYDGTLRRVYASPPSLTIDLPGTARPRVVVFGRMPGSRPRGSWLGFALYSDAQLVDEAAGGRHRARVDGHGALLVYRPARLAAAAAVAASHPSPSQHLWAVARCGWRAGPSLVRSTDTPWAAQRSLGPDGRLTHRRS
jgi:hypothetical protein